MNANEIVILILGIAGIALIGFLIAAIVYIIKMLKNLNQILCSMDKKITLLDPIFRSLSNIGEGLEYSTSKIKDRYALKCLHDHLNKEEGDSKTEHISEAIGLILKGVGLWNKVKKNQE